MVWKCDSSQNPPLAVRRELSGRGGATDPHGHSECSGVNSSRPAQGGRGELNSPASVRPLLDDMDKTVKPRGLSPRYFTIPRSGRSFGRSRVTIVLLPAVRESSVDSVRVSRWVRPSRRSATNSAGSRSRSSRVNTSKRKTRVRARARMQKAKKSARRRGGVPPGRYSGSRRRRTRACSSRGPSGRRADRTGSC